MPIVILIRLKGDTSALMTTLDALHVAQAGAEPAAGLVLHCLSGTVEGVLMVDVWQSAKDYRAFLESAEARRGGGTLGLPAPEVEIYDVHLLLGYPSELTAALRAQDT
jgi:hypothetical protein